MERFKGKVSLAALIVSIIALVVAAGGVSSASGGTPATKIVSRATAAAAGPVTKTFSFIGKAGSGTKTLVNVDQFLINARCGTTGNPVIFAFSQASKADLFGRFFDGLGRLHVVKNSSFVKGPKGTSLSTSSGDFDATGTVVFESSTGKVVTVNYAFDDSTTLAKTNVCTVYGSVTAT